MAKGQNMKKELPMWKDRLLDGSYRKMSLIDLIRHTQPLTLGPDIVSICPMSSPKEEIFYQQTFYDGLTSDQLFEKDLSEGKYKYTGKIILYKEIREPRYHFILDGDPDPPLPLIEVQEIEYDEYVGDHMKYHRNPIILHKYTPLEWEAMKKDKDGQINTN